MGMAEINLVRGAYSIRFEGHHHAVAKQQQISIVTDYNSEVRQKAGASN